MMRLRTPTTTTSDERTLRPEKKDENVDGEAASLRDSRSSVLGERFTQTTFSIFTYVKETLDFGIMAYHDHHHQHSSQSPYFAEDKPMLNAHILKEKPKYQLLLCRSNSPRVD